MNRILEDVPTMCDDNVSLAYCVRVSLLGHLVFVCSSKLKSETIYS